VTRRYGGIVQPDARQTRASAEALEGLRHRVRIQWLAVLTAEHQVLVLPDRPGQQAFGSLSPSVRPEGDHGRRIEGDPPAALGCLGAAVGEAFGSADACLLDRQRGPIEIEIAPAEAEHLAPSHPARECQPPQTGQAFA
jgi:hypothetical protein